MKPRALLARATSPRGLAVVMIVVPFVLAVVYYALFAAGRYVSESAVTVRQSNDTATSAIPGMALLLTGADPPSRQDALYLQRYILSEDLMLRLDGKLGLRRHYEGEHLDLLFRLFHSTSKERFLDYYRSRIDVAYDDPSSVLTVSVEAFDPAFAQALNREILAASEKFVNDVSHEMADEQLNFALRELRRNYDKLQAAKSAVLAFQTAHKLLNPINQAQADGGIDADLAIALSKAQVELNASLSYLQEGSPQVATLRNQIAAIKSQIASNRERSVDGPAPDRLNNLASQFQDLAMQATFAQDVYKLSLTAVESARVESTRKLKTVVVIEPPALAETPLYPRRLYNLLTLLTVSALLYALTRLIVATVRDHMD
jgi:capsular polysaccharide transport system permease protein